MIASIGPCAAKTPSTTSRSAASPTTSGTGLPVIRATRSAATGDVPDRSSRTTTSCPASRSDTAVCAPMYPAPPARRTRMMPAYPSGRAAAGRAVCRRSAPVEPPARLAQVAHGAHRLVGDLARDRPLVDGHLVAVEDEAAVHQARIEDRLAPAPADRLELLEAVGELEQPPRPREGLGAEVGAAAVGDHGDVIAHRDPQQILHQIG